MESYRNIVLRRIGYVLFLVVILVRLCGIWGSGAETAEMGEAPCPPAIACEYTEPVR